MGHAAMLHRKTHLALFALSCIVAQAASGREWTARGDGRRQAVRRALGEQPQQGGAPRLRAARHLARRHAARRAGAPPARRRGRLPQPRHHLLGLWRGGSGRADHPVRHRPARSSPPREWERLSAGLEQRVRAINAFIDDVYGARKILADGIVPADIVLGNPQYCIPCAGARAAARRLRPYLRDRPGPHRPRRFLRARGQCAHARRASPT